jgi:hypothetical protein
LKAQLAEYATCPAAKTTLELWKKIDSGQMTKTRHFEVGFEQIFDAFAGLVEKKKAGEEIEKILKNMTTSVEDRPNVVDVKKRKREEKKGQAASATTSEEKRNSEVINLTEDGKKKRKRQIDKKLIKYGVTASAVTDSNYSNLIQFVLSDDKPIGLAVVWMKGEVLDLDSGLFYHSYPDNDILQVEVLKGRSQCYLFSLFSLGTSSVDQIGISWAGKFDVYDLVGKRNIGIPPTTLKQEFNYVKKSDGEKEDWFLSDKNYREILKLSAAKKCSNVGERHDEFVNLRDKIIAAKTS